MVFARENAREFKNAPMAKLQAVFGDRLFGDACATPTDTEALHVVGACGMEFYAPVSDYILIRPSFSAILRLSARQIIFLPLTAATCAITPTMGKSFCPKIRRKP